MSKATTSGMGKGGLLLRLILSILLVFSLLGTVGSAVGVSVLCGPSQLISQMHRHDAGQKVYDSLNTRFQNDYNTTAVPAEVYMDTISVDWLEQCMENKVTALYGKGSGDIDFSALESSITDYFEKYAEENNCAKDDTYNEKLRETIDNGEKVISDATDLLRTETLQKSGYLSKLHKLRTLTFAGEGVCGVLTVLLLLLLRGGSGMLVVHGCECFLDYLIGWWMLTRREPSVKTASTCSRSIMSATPSMTSSLRSTLAAPFITSSTVLPSRAPSRAVEVM